MVAMSMLPGRGITELSSKPSGIRPMPPRCRNQRIIFWVGVARRRARVRVGICWRRDWMQNPEKGNWCSGRTNFLECGGLPPLCGVSITQRDQKTLFRQIPFSHTLHPIATPNANQVLRPSELGFYFFAVPGGYGFAEVGFVGQVAGQRGVVAKDNVFDVGLAGAHGLKIRPHVRLLLVPGDAAEG